MTESALVTAFGVGLAYVAIWAVYRTMRRREHRSYREIHAEERIRRSSFDADSGLPEFERRNRAEWDAKHGPLLGPLELRNREENRWPVGIALQGAATVTASVLIGMLIWQARPHTSAADHPNVAITDRHPNVGTGTSSDTRGGGEPTPTAQEQQVQLIRPAAGGELVAVFMFCTALIGGGIVLLHRPTSSAGSATGIALVATGSLLGGAKLLSVDKLISAKTLLSVQYTRVSDRPATVFSPVTYVIRLPSFTTGSAKTHPDLQGGHKVGSDPRSSEPGHKPLKRQSLSMPPHPFCRHSGGPRGVTP